MINCALPSPTRNVNKILQKQKSQIFCFKLYSTMNKFRPKRQKRRTLFVAIIAFWTCIHKTTSPITSARTSTLYCSQLSQDVLLSITFCKVLNIVHRSRKLPHNLQSKNFSQRKIKQKSPNIFLSLINFSYKMIR